MKYLVSFVPLTPFGLLAACGSGPEPGPEQRACATFVAERYQVDFPVPLGRMRVADESTTADALRERFYPAPLTESEEAHFAAFGDADLGLRVVTFDVDRYAEELLYLPRDFACRFVLVDGEPYRAGSLVEDAEEKGLDVRLDEMSTALGPGEMDHAYTSPYRNRILAEECCLPE